MESSQKYLAVLKMVERTDKNAVDMGRRQYTVSNSKCILHVDLNFYNNLFELTHQHAYTFEGASQSEPEKDAAKIATEVISKNLIRYGVPDSNGDVYVKGCFGESLKALEFSEDAKEIAKKFNVDLDHSVKFSTIENPIINPTQCKHPLSARVKNKIGMSGCLMCNTWLSNKI